MRMGVTAQAMDNTLYGAFGQSLASTMYPNSTSIMWSWKCKPISGSHQKG